jgi:acetyl-CoA carboxylase, biotin carboxylase subunit
VGAGTVEFLLSEDQSFYFLEMNTRLQVEHPITEMVTGIDLVQAQIRVAAGEVLVFAQKDIKQLGHAIECRIYAEDAQNNWAPSPGVLRGYQEPSGPWVRVDSGVKEGDEVTIFYDPMISKLIVWGQDREDALRRMSRALSEYRIRGIETTIPFFKSLLQDPDFIAGKYDTGFLSPERMEKLIPKNNYQEIAELAAVIYAFNRDQKMQSPVQQGQTTSKWKWSFR